MTTTKLSWYTYNWLTEKLGEMREKLMFQLHDTSFDNYHTNLLDISSNYLVCGNSDKNYDKDGYEVTLVWIFDFQSMPSLSYWSMW